MGNTRRTGDTMIISTIAVWVGMSAAVVAVYFMIHALTVVVYHIIDISRQLYWVMSDERDFCDYPFRDDIYP